MFALRAIKVSKIPKCNSAMGGTLAFSFDKPIGYRDWSSTVAQSKTIKINSLLVSVRRNWAPLANRCYAVEAKKYAKEDPIDANAANAAKAAEQSYAPPPLPPQPTSAATTNTASSTDDLPPNPFPDKEQLLNYFFRVLAFIWDASTYSFLWTRKFIMDTLAENPNYQEQLRQLKQKMDESKGNPEHKRPLKIKLDESKDETAANLKNQDLMKKIDESKANTAENQVHVQEQLLQLNKKIDESKEKFTENQKY